MSHQSQNEHYRKLRWRCHRGMLELDILLLRFLEEAYPYLTSTEQQQFEALLKYEDPELFSWLMGHENISESTLINIVKKIRNIATLNNKEVI